MNDQAVLSVAGSPEGAAGKLIEKIPAIPLQSQLHGPLVRGRLRRFYVMQFLLALAGLAPVLFSAAPQWQAFGLGIVWPGAGFLYAGGFFGVVLAVAAFALFLASLFYWWARGILPLPPAVLLLTAALSGWYVGEGPGWSWVHWGAPALLLAFHAALFSRRRKQFHAGLADARDFNATVSTITPLLRETPVQVRPEMTAPQIAEFRRVLDLALQPIDEWQGFTTHDKWQQDSLRYQVCTPTWNLGMTQYSQLPAFRGYLSRAQENLIRKHIDRKTWDYWRYESMWGNFSYQKDPIEIDNIMLSGFLGVSLGMFETASNSSPFREPGSLTFRWDQSLAFEYSHSRLCEALVNNFQRYDLGWFPCEPRWIYSMCNLVGFNALLFHDKRHGTSYAEQVEDRFFTTLDEEMLLPDGRMRVCTSAPFGFTVPTLSGLFGEAWGIRFMTTFAPERAERLWQVMRRQFIEVKPDGDIDYKLMELGWDTRQPSDFRRWADINPLIVTLWAALEMGDEEIVEGVSRKLDSKYGEGVAEAMSFGKANTVRDMVTKGLPEAWRTGPVLQDAIYPEVIVSRAVTDGKALELVLSPGEGRVESQITLAQLVPGRAYRVQQTGREFVATPGGEAVLKLQLESRTPVNIVPVE